MAKKNYYDFMDELSPEEIYEGLLAHGLFAEKLPPIFTSEAFFKHCNENTAQFDPKKTEYIYYESIRNINMPRAFGVPNPFSYQQLCKYISDNWDKFQSYFKCETASQEHIISRIHIRKTKKDKSLFSMNYKDWKTDGDPEPDLLLGNKYVVHADISNFFPSIYSHALPWALVGKNVAKQNINKNNKWYNKLDLYVRNIKNGETHGLLIGPHVSNLLSEIILVKIDNALYERGWRYVRNIDDYTCYVSSYEKGQLFLTELSEQLRFYGLSLNHKKTLINKLPMAAAEQWVRKINTFATLGLGKMLSYKEVRAYLDFAIELMQKNNNNAAVLNYVIKVLSKKQLTNNAKSYYFKTIFHLAIIYPYLVPLLEEYVYEPFDVEPKMIADASKLFYREAINIKNFEALCYVVYYALKYNFELKDLDFDVAKNSNHCLFLLLAFLYFKKRNNKEASKLFIEYAEQLKETDMNSCWLFIYEVLPESKLKCHWKAIKKKKITFLKHI